jgi:glyoxylase-like metal-dependent hydrolase (beta-lactamase superfamily II)
MIFTDLRGDDGIMRWQQFPVGPLEANCYVLYDDRFCLVVDPGDEAETVISWLEANDLRPGAVFLTHAHFDHIGGLDDLVRKYPVPVYLHQAEKDWLQSPSLNGSLLFLPRPVVSGVSPKEIKGEGEMEMGGWSFQILETPGHSPGSISLYFAEEGILVSGDVIFKGSVGRTDLPGGNGRQLMETLGKKILPLPEETRILPGHGPVTTVGEEKTSNPFLQG